MYLPADVPDKPEELAAFLRLELQRISQASVDGLVYLKPLNVEPRKRSDGMVVKADGTNWNPGSGEGVYAYYAGAWAKLVGSPGSVGLYGVTPVARATTGGASSTFAAVAGIAVTDTSTFDGYTLGKVVKALRNIGVLT